ncbi:nuclear RNA export factor 2-like [Echinops telfairi]|uniref:Nuclear RNA export factor 2-like n=1 Tax=Echinops telfairi TaxID=9371 RepID=A0AC55D435_ECHTE|nr:nuclear RNA export factor 2-like [Echinops telfairi]
MVGEEQKEDSPQWFKVAITDGRKYKKPWLLSSIQSHCSVPFTPIDFHYVGLRAQFFISDASIASALKDVSDKILDDNSQKISIVVSPTIVPNCERNKLKPEKMEQLKVAMKKRYLASHQALDLQSFRFDPILVDHGIDMILNRKSCMDAALTIIEEDFPELLSLNLRNNKLYRLDSLSNIVEMAPKLQILNLSKNELKSAWELDKIKGLNLKELWLKGNPLCRNYSNNSTYVSTLLELFPKLTRLDGLELFSTLSCGNGKKKLPVCKGSVYGSDTLKSLIWQFLTEYYYIYDHGDRHVLLNTYHDNACFSLTVPFNSDDGVLGSLNLYSKSSRNMIKIKDSVPRTQLLKYTKTEIVDFLSALPKTQHDLSSFVVDTCVQTENMFYFSVNGQFKEVETSYLPHNCDFTRIFILNRTSNSSLCIVNDQLFVKDIRFDEPKTDLLIGHIIL